MSTFDVEAMLASCLPGGEVCDPQQVADSIRGYLASRAPVQALGEALAEAIAQCELHNSSASHITSAEKLNRWRAALAHRATAQAQAQPSGNSGKLTSDRAAVGDPVAADEDFAQLRTWGRDGEEECSHDECDEEGTCLECGKTHCRSGQ